MNDLNRNKIIDTENVLMVVRWEKSWGMHEKGEGTKKYKFIVTE